MRAQSVEEMGIRARIQQAEAERKRAEHELQGLVGDNRAMGGLGFGFMSDRVRELEREASGAAHRRDSAIADLAELEAREDLAKPDAHQE
jgi:hypothetical protein